MKIVAIGGGENGRTKILPDGTIKQYPFENTLINKKIIELSYSNSRNSWQRFAVLYRFSDNTFSILGG